MATTKEFKEYVVEQLSMLDGIVCRPMMGEYLLYCNKVLFGGIYDGRLLIKITAGNQKYNLPEALPYKGAKMMYQVEDLDNQELLKEIVLETCKSLEAKKR